MTGLPGLATGVSRHVLSRSVDIGIKRMTSKYNTATGLLAVNGGLMVDGVSGALTEGAKIAAPLAVGRWVDPVAGSATETVIYGWGLYGVD
jgi:hypothetical protein